MKHHDTVVVSLTHRAALDFIQKQGWIAEGGAAFMKMEKGHWTRASLEGAILHELGAKE